jgi:hypothetical protein
MDFLERVLAEVNAEGKLRSYTFFDSQLVHPFLLQDFVLNAMEYFPMGIAGFRPEAGPCKIPDYEDATNIDPHGTYSMMKEKPEGLALSDLFPSAPPMLYYIPGEQDKARRELTGRGGYTVILSKLKQAEFFDHTKQMLAKNTTDKAMLRMPMSVPVLSSASFTQSLRPALQQMFSLFDLYVTENQRDKGLLIAANRCLDDQMEEFVTASRLNASGLRRPGIFSSLRGGRLQ